MISLDLSPITTTKNKYLWLIFEIVCSTFELKIWFFALTSPVHESKGVYNYTLRIRSLLFVFSYGTMPC